MIPRKNRAFVCAWNVAAGMGWCDSYGSAEYRRLLVIWILRGRPKPILAWIRKQANLAPEVLNLSRRSGMEGTA